MYYCYSRCVSGIAPCTAFCAAGLKDRLRDEYPKALTDLEAFYRRIQASGKLTETTRTRDLKEVVNVNKLTYSATGRNSKVEVFFDLQDRGSSDRSLNGLAALIQGTPLSFKG